MRIFLSGTQQYRSNISSVRNILKFRFLPAGISVPMGTRVPRMPTSDEDSKHFLYSFVENFETLGDKCSPVNVEEWVILKFLSTIEKNAIFSRISTKGQLQVPIHKLISNFLVIIFDKSKKYLTLLEISRRAAHENLTTKKARNGRYASLRSLSRSEKKCFVKKLHNKKSKSWRNLSN